MSAEEELMAELRAATRTSYGRAQIEAVEAVLAKAQAQGLGKAEHAVRLHLVEAYFFGGEPEKLFAAFAWCLADYERGEREHEFMLLWAFKWVVQAALWFPRTPLATIRSVLGDMERRYRAAGQSLQPVHEYRRYLAQHVGDRAAAAEEYRLWTLTPRGEISNCRVCEPSAKIAYLVWAHEYQEAVAAGLTALETGMRCSSQPQVMMTVLLEPCWRLGLAEQGRQMHRLAYSALRGERSETALITEHISFCAHIGDTDRGFELAERYLTWLDDPASPAQDMRLSTACALAFQKAAAAGRGGELVRRGSRGEISVGELGAELEARALAIAARFDERNGTCEQTRSIRRSLAGE